MTRRLRVGTLGMILAVTGCITETIELPGQTFNVPLNIELARFSTNDLDAIGTFLLTVTVNGSATDYTLLFRNRALSFVDDPAPLPASGTLELHLVARDQSGATTSLGISGHFGPVQLDDLVAGADPAIDILVAREDAFTETNVALAQGRYLHTTTDLGDGSLLVVGGATGVDPTAPTGFADRVEWIDPFARETCDTGGGGTGTCVWVSWPSPRIGHVAVRIPDDASCAVAGQVVVGLGRDEAGTAHTDAFLFDPALLEDAAGPFSPLGVTLTPRIDGFAYATGDCRVVVAGGHDAAGASVDLADVISWDAGGTPSVTTPVLFASSHPAVVPLGNAVDDVLIIGGEKDTGGGPAPFNAAIRITHADDAFDVCYLTQDQDDTGATGCNGGIEALSCLRPRPAAALLPGQGVQSPVVLMGTQSDGSCGGSGQFNAEVASLQLQGPFNLISPVATGAVAAVQRYRGHTLSAQHDGRVLLAGGLPPPSVGNQPIGTLEYFTLGQYNGGAQLWAGAFSTLISGLNPARAHHTATTVGRVVIAVGGWTLVGASSRVDVFTAGQ